MFYCRWAAVAALPLQVVQSNFYCISSKLWCFVIIISWTISLTHCRCHSAILWCYCCCCLSLAISFSSSKNILFVHGVRSHLSTDLSTSNESIIVSTKKMRIQKAEKQSKQSNCWHVIHDFYQIMMEEAAIKRNTRMSCVWYQFVVIDKLKTNCERTFRGDLGHTGEK